MRWQIHVSRPPKMELLSSLWMTIVMFNLDCLPPFNPLCPHFPA
jgi:hypothetical protein